MSIISWILGKSGPQGMTGRHFRYPALAEANKALIALEEEVVDSTKISHQMDEYKKAQAISEKDRDAAFIPIYFDLERYVVENPPPATRTALNRKMVRAKVRSRIDLSKMNEMFRLIFLPENEQTDHLLKIGVLDLLNFLLTGLGAVQLQTVVAQAGSETVLAGIRVTDDGIFFDDVHKKMAFLNKEGVLLAYQQLYKGLFNEIQSLFGEKVAIQQLITARQKIESLYDSDLVSIFINVLPVKL